MIGIVLAESAERGKLTRESKERIELGADLLRKRGVNKLILSGGVRKRKGFEEFIGNYHSFAEIMKEYAMKIGVTEDRIILEDLSEDTIGQLIFVKEGILKPRKIKTVTIISHDYHIPRIREFSRKIFDESYNLYFSPVITENKTEHKIGRLDIFNQTFKGVDFSDREEVLNALLTKHQFYSQHPGFYRKELKKMISVNSK
jgi:uncharacterized SAM-binding protein YcdF (DUF218 family)